MARVSILMPCRDAAAFLAAAIASLDSQTFTDYEVIAVNDGSTDATGAMLDAWAERNARVRVMHTGARGIVAALQDAAAAASGELLARMDADDVAHPTRLARQITFLEQAPSIGACGTRIRYFPHEDVRAGARRYEYWLNRLLMPEEIERELFIECPIAHPTLVVRRADFERAGGYQDQGWPEDYDLVLRLWAAGTQLAKVPEVLLDWREGTRRLSRTAERYDQWQFQRCKAHYLMRTHGRGRGFVVWGAGPVGKRFARALLAGGARIEAFVDVDARKIGQTIHDVPVVRPEAIVDFADAYAVSAVAGVIPRAEIRAQLLAAGRRELRDFCAVA